MLPSLTFQHGVGSGGNFIKVGRLPLPAMSHEVVHRGRTPFRTLHAIQAARTPQGKVTSQFSKGFQMLQGKRKIVPMTTSLSTPHTPTSFSCPTPIPWLIPVPGPYPKHLTIENWSCSIPCLIPDSLPFLAHSIPYPRHQRFRHRDLMSLCSSQNCQPSQLANSLQEKSR